MAAAAMFPEGAAPEPGLILTTWVAQGPAPTTNAQVQNLSPNNEVDGAIHAVVAHPTDPNTLYVGAVNGGVWRTTNATAASPTWTPLTDLERSLSTGALEMDPGNSMILLAGIGRFSSFGGDPPFQIAGGDLNGLLRTTNGGNTWTAITDPLLVGEHISCVASRGSILLAGANNFFGGGGGGLFRSTDTGGAWVQVTGLAGTGLPAGSVDDMAGDPSSASRLYAALQGNGVYRTDDTGANWTQVSNNDPALNGAMGGSTNTRIAVAGDARVFVLVTSGSTGITTYIGFSDDQGGNWTQMDVPGTAETALQGRDELMGMVVDPANSDIVYISGITQRGPFNNSVGATSFHAHMFRGDVTRARGLTGTVSNQWDHLTHATGNALMPNGGTASTSAPHADSRELTFDANGNLIEASDGGVHRRTNPGNNTGDWFSISGNIQVTELHSIAYDTNFDIIIGGTQDTGANEQSAPGSTTWNEILVADGSKVTVSDSVPGSSVRYLSTQNLGNFTRRTCNPLCANASPALAGAGGAQFYTPVEAHATDSTRLLLGTTGGLSESMDQGNNAAIVPGSAVTATSDAAMVYGHPTNAELIYIGSGSQVFVRTTAGGNLAATAGAFPGGTVFGVTVDPADANHVIAIDTNSVYRSVDGGTNWSNITGNITSDGAGTFRAIDYIEGATMDRVVVGTNQGVFLSFEDSLGSWFELGTNLPNTLVWDLDYDATDDVLVAGTLGRGAWILTGASLVEVPPIITVPGSVQFDDTCVDDTGFATLNVCNTGGPNLVVDEITSDNPDVVVTTPSSGYPVIISPDFCFPFEVVFTPSGPGPVSAILTIPSNDPARPSVEVDVSGFAGDPRIATIIANAGSFGDVCKDTIKDLDLTISNSGDCALIVTNITSSDPANFDVPGVMDYPLVIGPQDSLRIPLRHSPNTMGPHAGNFTIFTNDPGFPAGFGKVVDVSGNTPYGDVRITGSSDFGNVCAGVLAEKQISVCNVGACNLSVLAGTGFDPPCDDFKLINKWFPAMVSPDFCMDLVIRFTPQSVGDKSCTLKILTDDPDQMVTLVPVTGTAPQPMIDVPPDIAFPPEVIQSVDSCVTQEPFPISNTGICPLEITNVATLTVKALPADPDEYFTSGLPSFPILLDSGHIAGAGDLSIDFRPQFIDRARLGMVDVTYVSDPFTPVPETTVVTRSVCGEGTFTGARVLVTEGRVPVAEVKSLKLHRLTANRNKDRLDSVDTSQNLPLTASPPLPAPCGSFQYHREYGTVSNPVQLSTGSYQVTAQIRSASGQMRKKSVGFNVNSCDFNPTIIIDF